MVSGIGVGFDCGRGTPPVTLTDKLVIRLPVELEPIVVTVAGAAVPVRALPYAVSVGGDSLVTRAQRSIEAGAVEARLATRREPTFA